MEMPSPGMVTEPHRTSKAMPMPMMVHPANWANICEGKVVHSRPAVNAMLRSMSHPNANPMTSWKSCMGSKLRRRMSIWQNTRIKFIAIVYPPIVHSGTRLIGPASEKTNGSEEITLLPNEDFTHRTTPNVIRYNEIRSRRCCQRNDIAFSLFVITYNISIFYYRYL